MFVSLPNLRFLPPLWNSRFELHLLHHTAICVSCQAGEEMKEAEELEEAEEVGCRAPISAFARCRTTRREIQPGKRPTIWQRVFFCAPPDEPRKLIWKGPV